MNFGDSLQLKPRVTPQTLLAPLFEFLIDRLPFEITKPRRRVRGERLAAMNVIVSNPEIVGTRLGDLSVLDSSEVVVSRIKHRGYVSVATPDDILHLRDVLLFVGPREELEEMRLVIGHVSRSDLRVEKSSLVALRIRVTRMTAAGKRLGDFDLIARRRVVATRVEREDEELVAAPEHRLALGDTIVLVGRNRDVMRLVPQLGRPVKQSA